MSEKPYNPNNAQRANDQGEAMKAWLKFNADIDVDAPENGEKGAGTNDNQADKQNDQQAQENEKEKEQTLKNLRNRVKNAIARHKNKYGDRLQIESRDHAEEVGRANPYMRYTLQSNKIQDQLTEKERNQLENDGITDEKAQDFFLKKNSSPYGNSKGKTEKEIQDWWNNLEKDKQKEMLDAYRENKRRLNKKESNYGHDFVKFLDEQLDQQSNERIAELEKTLNQQQNYQGEEKQAEQPVSGKEGESSEDTAEKQDTQPSSGEGDGETTASKIEDLPEETNDQEAEKELKDQFENFRSTFKAYNMDFDDAWKYMSAQEGVFNEDEIKKWWENLPSNSGVKDVARVVSQKLQDKTGNNALYQVRQNLHLH